MLPETKEMALVLKIPSSIQRGIRLIEKETGESLFMALCEGEDVDGFMSELKETGDFSQIIFNQSECYPTLFNILYTDDLLEAIDHYNHGFYIGDVSEEIERYYWNLWCSRIYESWSIYLEEDLSYAAEVEENIADMLRESKS